MSPMKLMPWTKHQKEETLEEINRKMQRALEEALMKNISLQEVWYCLCMLCMYIMCVCACLHQSECVCVFVFVVVA